MKRDGFYAEIRRDTESLWRATLDHPFVRGIGDGTLSRDRFEFYLKQDYVYLIDFSRVFGLAAVKSAALSDMEFFSTLMSATLGSEMELHRRTCAAFGISREALEGTRKALITSAYTDYLVRTCLEGDLADILAVLTPCACGYAEIAIVLKEKGLPDNM
ncbi:MAG: thiaminase II, partial [Syntrophorhabdaceae bacterium]|nr:thiaminase II [Syntrophorhabdaceae bacterium]